MVLPIDMDRPKKFNSLSKVSHCLWENNLSIRFAGSLFLLHTAKKLVIFEVPELTVTSLLDYLIIIYNRGLKSIIR